MNRFNISMLFFCFSIAIASLSPGNATDKSKPLPSNRQREVGFERSAHPSIASRSDPASFQRPPALHEPNPGAETLRAYASKLGLYIGSMMDSMPGNGWETAWVKQTLGSEFNVMEPGNQLKWAITEPSRGKFNFAPADSLVEYAISHNMKVRGHNLLWGMSNPDWLGNGPARTYRKFTGAQLEAILVNHIRTVMGHYRDKYPGVVKWWDVTNEVMGWNDKFNSDGILWSKIGSNPDRADYFRIAYRAAREADPDAILCMNEWGNDGSNPKRTQNLIEIIKAFKAEGIPIDCVGMEMHLDVGSAPAYEKLLGAMKAYADIGIQVQITEFDIKAPRSAANWDIVSAIASNALKACVNSPNCTAFNNWGFSQTYYIGDSGQQDIITLLPWNTDNEKDPEYFAMQDVLRKGSRLK
jgi:endo-1,4-beta-xylanase